MLKTLVKKMDSSHCVECLPSLSLSDNQPLDGEGRGDVVSSFTVPLDVRLDFSCYFHSVRSAHCFHTGGFCRFCCVSTCFFVLFISFIHSFFVRFTISINVEIDHGGSLGCRCSHRSLLPCAAGCGCSRTCFSFISHSFFLCFFLINHGAPDASRTTIMAMPFDQESWCVALVCCWCDGMMSSLEW